MNEMQRKGRTVGLAAGLGRGPIGHSVRSKPGLLAKLTVRSVRRWLCTLTIGLLLVPAPIAGAAGQSLRQWCAENAEELPHADVVRAVFPDMPVMLYVACCESRGKEDARNKRSSAVGLFQIMASYWRDYARKNGHDLLSAKGNAEVAAYIVDVQGLNAWRASKHCWQGQD